MNSISCNQPGQPEAATAPSQISSMEDERHGQQKAVHLLYQAATVLAILLFLISF